MTFWVYRIDWRSRAIDIVAEVQNEFAADVKIGEIISKMSKEQLEVHAQYQSLSSTPVSAEMLAASKQWRLIGGKEMAS